MEGEAWVVMYAAKQTPTVLATLQGSGALEQSCDCRKLEAMYKKGWWQTGDKHLCKGQDWTLWTSVGIPLFEWGAVRGTETLPWLEPVDAEREDLKRYYDGIYRGDMQHNPGRRIWTDGYCM